MRTLEITLTAVAGRIDRVAAWVNGKKKIDTNPPAGRSVRVRNTPSRLKVRVLGGAGAVFRVEVQQGIDPGAGESMRWSRQLGRELTLDAHGVYRREFDV
jgi:hypothetical protein